MRTIKIFVTKSLSGLILAFSYLTISSSVFAETDQLFIEEATSATVLIKTHLKHGFIDDDEATDRWRGTGFLIDKAEGLIITNAHVAGFGVSTLRLQFEDQNQFTEGKKVFLDGKHDVAVIQVDPSAIPSATKELTFDCDYSLQRGNRVFSLG